MMSREAKIAWAIFGGVFLLLLAIDGNRLLPGTNDEGIYLDAAERMLHGHRLYTDFFGYITPGVYWVQEFFFRVFGVTMTAGRLPVLLYFSAECALLFFLAARLASPGAAFLALLMYFSIEASDLSLLTAQHRWDSGAIALGSIAFAVSGHLGKRKFDWMAAGALSVLAAFFTPSMAFVTAATAMWLVFARELRLRLVPFLGGGLGAGAVLVLACAATGLLFPFLDQMRWLSRNYSGVNVMAYGQTIGGYGNLLEGPRDFSMLIRGLVVLSLALPAILPVTNLAGWPVALALRPPGNPVKRRAIQYLLVCSVALVASTYPRPDLTHLAWVAPVAFVLAAALIAQAASRWIQASVIVIAIFGAAILLLYLAGTLGGARLNSPVGEVRVAKNLAPDIERLLSTVKPGDTAFVHPYKPLMYFLTQSVNPTRYSYLAPGLMTDQDEDSALNDLRGSPPRWVMLLRLTPQEFLRVFPNADLSRMRYNRLEDWIDQNYSPVDPPLDVMGYRLLRLH